MSSYDRIALAPTAGEAEVLRLAARAAEDEADFEGALRLVRGLPEGLDRDLWQEQLELAARSPAHAPERACWVVHPALRWALERPAGEILEAYARLMLMTLGVTAGDRPALWEAVAMTDSAVGDAALFEAGLFAGYLATAARPALLEGAGQVWEWPACPPSVWEFLRVRRGRVELRDGWDGQEGACLAWAGADSLRAGDQLYGRLVPVGGSGNTELAFALPATRVDSRCAARILLGRRRGADAQERIRAVAHSRRREEVALIRSGS